MFGNKETAPQADNYAHLTSGTQYAIAFRHIGSYASDMAKDINNWLKKYPNHKVIQMVFGKDMGGAVVVFEVK